MEQVTLTSEQVIIAETLAVEKLTISETETVIVDNSVPVTIVTGLLGPKGKDGKDGTAVNIGSLLDVDTTYLPDGSVLVYSATAQKWQSTNILQNQIMESGQY